MIFGISGTKPTVRNREISRYYGGVRKERLDCNFIVCTFGGRRMSGFRSSSGRGPLRSLRSQEAKTKARSE